MALNVTTAAIASGANTAIAQPSLAQWDQGQILKIEGVELPQSYQVEFSGGGTIRTVPMIGTAEGVQIPNKLLQSSHPITAHIVLHEDVTDRETEYWITIYVKPRQAPETVEIDPADISIIDQTIAAAQQAVATSTDQAEAAAGSAEEAAASAEAAEASAQAAAGSASAAASSASAAAGSATAAASAQTAAETAQGAAETAQAAAEQAVTDAQAAGSQAVEAIDEAKTAGIQAIDAEAATQIDQVGRAGATQIQQINTLSSNQMQSIETKTTQSIGAIEDAKDAAIDDVQTEGQTQTAAAQAQAQAAAGSATAAANSASAAASSASAAATARTGAETAAASVSASAAQIAQNAEDISNLNRQLNDETTGLDTKAPVILETASGAIASFDDGADGMPIKSLVAQIEPVQDLHGYDSPWPAGGGANICDPLLKFTAGTYYGVTLSTNDGYQFSISGTATGSGNISCQTIPVADAVVYPAGTYTSTGAIFATYKPDGSWYTNRQVGTWTADSDFIVRSAYIQIVEGTSPTGKLRFLSLTKGSTALTSWSPYENICPISGHTGAEIEQTGVNVWDEEWELGQFNNATGVPIAANDCVRTKNFIDVKPQKTYHTTYGNGKMQVFFYKADGSYISQTWVGVTNNIITPADCYKMKFRLASAYGTTYNHDISINYPATDTTYHPYTGNQISVTFPDTIYGGEDEVISGKLKSTMGVIVLDGTQTISIANWQQRAGSSAWLYPLAMTPNINKPTGGSVIPNLLSDTLKIDTYSNVYNGSLGVSTISGNENYSLCVRVAGEEYRTIADINAYLSANPIKVVYELTEPVEYTLTGNEITTLYGQNNIWSSTGDTEVTYPADTKLFIEKLTQPTEDDMTADHAISTGTFFMLGNTLYLATAAIAAGATITPGTNATKLSLADALNQLNT